MAFQSGSSVQATAGPAIVRGGRLVYLEAGRGIASIVVLLHHLVLAFKPKLDEAYPLGLQFTPLYVAINGGAAVSFFFVLSGFVLSLSLIQSPSRSRLATSVVKRWPRLALPAVVTLVAGCLILADVGLADAFGVLSDDIVPLQDEQHRSLPGAEHLFVLR